MLTGNLEVAREGLRPLKYHINGVDTSTVCQLFIEGITEDSIQYMSGTIEEDPFALDTRRVDINLAKIAVSTYVSKKDGKKVKAPINTDLFCMLGALLRYAKMNCTKANEDGFSNIALASGEFEAVPESSYTIKFPMKDEVFATVRLKFGELQELHLKTDTITLNMVDDAGLELQLFPKIVDGITTGFKFTSEYLGFPIPEQKPTEVIGVNGMYTCIEDIVEAHPEKELSWLLKKDYKIVDESNLESIVDYIRNWNGYVYYDTETSGLNINFRSRTGQADQLVGVVLSVKYGESFFFPTQMKSIPNLCGGDHWYFMEHYMRPILEGKELVAHNAPFDWKVAYIYDINANIVHDTLALIKLTLGADHENFPISLKELAKLLLGRDSLELSDLVRDNTWGESETRFWDLPYELVKLYACADTDNTNGLLGYAQQADLLNKYNAKKIYEIELAFGFAVAYQEFYGHRLDIQNLDKMREEIGKEQDNLMAEMVKMVGHEFNPNSPQQLRDIMYKELGIPPQVSRKTGNLTTDKETLQKLAELTDAEDNIKYPFCKLLQDFRVAEGVRKIVDKFPEHVTEDGYVFSEVWQYGTTTGRVSIHKPNYQSYNDPIKKNVIPRPGFWMFDTDYSSVEYRVLGNMVGNKGIMKAFEDPDFDYHAYQAAHMYGIPYSAVTKKLRKAAKGINFGLPYGMGDESLGIRVFGEASPENTRKAASLRAAYFKGQEDIRDWFEYHRNRGVVEGFTETYFGRRRYYHKNKFSVNAIRRQAGNQVIQGCQDLSSRILTKEFGIVQLGDVLDTKVTVWNGLDWSNADVLSAGNKQKTIIKFKGGQQMICSPNHMFLVSTKRGGTMWVQAKDLHTTSEYKNPHRIIVNQRYKKADWQYKSDYKYNSDANNANNYYLDDIDSSFGIGVFLGRLASDGSQSLHWKTSSNYLKLCVAGHEYNIVNQLKEILSNWNYTEDNTGLRDETRLEAMLYYTIYSISLAKEIDSLDIRHKIHKNIFMDTEVLRGFLCGYFDGDGGISGKTITCVFGKQDDFSTLVHDMQIALMFFGVRSRIREYEDRWVIQIKTNDNPEFLYNIGFLNKDKQAKGFTLECIEDEHTFGKCVIAESVEVTDELIPMADVCNTEGGFYVVDGIVTHNTAADIYKTAVGRVFKRICREGWLGKVMFTGFIHDELLGEVSNDINPGVFLKVLREEFEVKITNPDGSPWCPLYMGFGYGMSWYEAKSVELPIKLQWEIVDKYGETGFPEWDGDGRKFCDTIPSKLRDFDVRDIRNQILDADSQGKEIKPTLNNQIFDCVKEDAKCYNKGIKEYASDVGFDIENAENLQSWLSENESNIVSYLDSHYFIQSLMRQDGDIRIDFKPSKETQEAITQYCNLHGVDRSQVNLLNIVEYNEASTPESNEILGGYDYEELDSASKLAVIKESRIEALGVYVDTDNKEITMQMVPKEYLAYIQSHVNHNGEGYKVFFKELSTGKLYETPAYIESKEIQYIQDMYIQYLGKKGV